MRNLRSLIGIFISIGLLTALAVSPAFAQPRFDPPGLERAIEAQEQHTNALLDIQGVAGTGVGLGPDGQAVVVIYLETPAAAANVPDVLDRIPVKKVVTGRFNAYAPPPLDAEFTRSCSGLTCDFDASATVGRGKKNYTWDFGDGNAATGEKVSHPYAASGTYAVTLTTSNSGGETDTQLYNVTVNGGGGANNPPTASFTVSCFGLTCDFPDTSTDAGGTVSTWSWNFGDGNTSTTQHPTHEFYIGDTYTVSLTVTDDGGATDTAIQTVSVECLPTGRCSQPVPIGVSFGHPDITAGTIGARVTDGTYVYALSNNHVIADENNASIDDNALQPGPFDGGIDPDDAIGTLYDYQPIVFNDNTANNVMDAAIANSSPTLLGNSTLPDGYGTPSTAIVDASLGLLVQKYGRTTGWTLGEVSEINVTVSVCYEGTVTCTKWARFVDQIAITPGDFSAGGDSGSLIVTQSGKKAVGLLFAGSSTRTIANRIEPVLTRFGVSIDGEPPPPTGTISGTVTDLSGGDLIGGVTVSTETGETTTTSSDGTYTLTDVPTGERQVTASASGYASQTTTDTVNENQTTTVDFVLDPETTATSVSVDSFTYATEGGRNNDKHLLITVALVDSLGNPVSGASVLITLSHASGSSWSGTATTGGDGKVTFTLKNAPSGCYTTTVTNVIADGLTWLSNDPSNVSQPQFCK